MELERRLQPIDEPNNVEPRMRGFQWVRDDS